METIYIKGQIDKISRIVKNLHKIFSPKNGITQKQIESLGFVKNTLGYGNNDKTASYEITKKVSDGREFNYRLTVWIRMNRFSLMKTKDSNYEKPIFSSIELKSIKELKFMLDKSDLYKYCMP